MQRLGSVDCGSVLTRLHYRRFGRGTVSEVGNEFLSLTSVYGGTHKKVPPFIFFFLKINKVVASE